VRTLANIFGSRIITDLIYGRFGFWFFNALLSPESFTYCIFNEYLAIFFTFIDLKIWMENVRVGTINNGDEEKSKMNLRIEKEWLVVLVFDNWKITNVFIHYNVLLIL
jgi:hypothetical protein